MESLANSTNRARRQGAAACPAILAVARRLYSMAWALYTAGVRRVGTRQPHLACTLPMTVRMIPSPPSAARGGAGHARYDLALDDLDAIGSTGFPTDHHDVNHAVSIVVREWLHCAAALPAAHTEPKVRPV